MADGSGFRLHLTLHGSPSGVLFVVVLLNVRVGWLRGAATPSLYERDSRGRLSLREQKFFRPKFLDRIPQLRRLLEFKPFGRLSHIAL